MWKSGTRDAQRERERERERERGLSSVGMSFFVLKKGLKRLQESDALAVDWWAADANKKSDAAERVSVCVLFGFLRSIYGRFPDTSIWVRSIVPTRSYASRVAFPEDDPSSNASRLVSTTFVPFFLNSKGNRRSFGRTRSSRRCATTTWRDDWRLRDFCVHRVS